MTSRTVLLWILGIALVSLIALTTVAEEPVYEKNFYTWDGEDGRNLIMVPPSRLEKALFQIDGESPESLGVPLKRWNLFVEQLTYDRDGRRRCSFSSHDGVDGYPDPNLPNVELVPGSRTALGPIRARSTAIVGRVEAIVPSWSFESSVITLVFLRIEEVLKDDDATLRAGELVTIMVPWGELVLGQRSLCAYQPKGTFDFYLDDLFVVTGRIDPWNDNHIVASDSFYYKIVDDVVTYAPRHIDFKAEPPLTLDRVRQELSDLSSN